MYGAAWWPLQVLSHIIPITHYFHYVWTQHPDLRWTWREDPRKLEPEAYMKVKESAWFIPLTHALGPIARELLPKENWDPGVQGKYDLGMHVEILRYQLYMSRWC